jgi:hypothetical protein
MIFLSMLHILQAPIYFNDHCLLCYLFEVVYLIYFPFNLLRRKKLNSYIIVWRLINLLPLLTFSICSTFPSTHWDSQELKEKKEQGAYRGIICICYIYLMLLIYSTLALGTCMRLVIYYCIQRLNWVPSHRIILSYNCILS